MAWISPVYFVKLQEHVMIAAQPSSLPSYVTGPRPVDVGDSGFYQYRYATNGKIL